MNILIDIGHPAHVHYYKKFVKEIIKYDFCVLFTCQNKEMTIKLLDYYNFKYIKLGRPYKSLVGKIWGLFFFTFKIFFISIKFKPNIYLNASMYSAIVARLLGKPHISLEDTFNMEQVKLYRPFTHCILTGDYEHPPMGKKEISYSGYQELLYLNPNRFDPDKSILQELGVLLDEKYVILRFVSWNASHDFGHKGISFQNKLKAVNEFLKYGKVFISSESLLPEELQPYQIPIPPERMHDALAFASLLWGESFTMPAECSILGVPSIINHNTTSYYLKEQEEKYGLCFNYTESMEDQNKAIAKGIELLKRDKKELHIEWQQKRERMLKDKIDVTAFLVWFVKNYPQSKKIMQENPDYQWKFK